MRIKIKITFIPVIGLFVLTSCNNIDFKNLEPAFIRIPSVEVRGPDSKPEPFHAVEDLWVFLDEEYLGTYPVPSEIPVLNTGKAKSIRIFPGIREFGIRSRAEIYNFMDTHTIQTDLDPEAVYSFIPVFRYKPGIKTLFFEDFETGNQLTLDLDQDKTNHIVRSDVTAQTGNYSGLIVNDVQHPLTEAATAGLRIISNSFLELSFRSSNDFNVGLNIIKGTTQSRNYFLILKASDQWKKIYIPFREFVDQNPETTYQLIFKGEYRQESGPSQSIFLDDLKIISLP